MNTPNRVRVTTTVVFALIAMGLVIAFVAFRTISLDSRTAAGIVPPGTKQMAKPAGLSPIPQPLLESEQAEGVTLLRPDPADGTRVQSSVIAKDLAKLLSKARNDPSLAFALASALNTCSGADRAYRRLAKEADNPSINAEEKLEEYDRRYAMCAGLTAADLDHQYDLMAMAARAGLLKAQVNYREVVAEAISSGYVLREPNAMDEIRTNLETFLNAAARTGDPEGLYQAFTLYNRGEIVPRDPVRALALYERYARAVGSVSPTQTRLIQEQLARLRRGMTPDELLRAQAGG